MIVATAGHVDHGKTSLIRALTGVDTDALPEEKSRGMSIDLGFAYLPMPDEAGAAREAIGFVDVPGHLDFIRNTLTGFGAADGALLVVAADDGPMPQTLEHLAALDLLGIPVVAVAVTKTDRVDAARIAQCTDAVQRLLADADAEVPVFAVSAGNAASVAALRSHLIRAAAARAEQTDVGNFRLAVDRCFSVAGAGAVVTGTVVSGRLAAGETVRVLQAGQEGRVRGLRVHGLEASGCRAGQRAALNLAGSLIRREGIHRGDWVVVGAVPPPQRKMDARLRVLPSRQRPLKHWSAVHVHLGAGHTTARVALLEGTQIEPGHDALVQLVLDQPLAAVSADRFLVRDAGAQATLGGGSIIDLFSPPRGRASPQRLAQLRAMEEPDPAQALERLLASAPAGVALEAFQQCRNLTDSEAAALFETVVAKRLPTLHGPLAFSQARWRELGEAVVRNLRAAHERAPSRLGPPADRILQGEARGLPREAVLALAHELQREGLIRQRGMAVCLPSHEPRLDADDQTLWEQLRPLLAEGRQRPPTVFELSYALRLPSARIEAALAHAAQCGHVVRVSPRRYYLPEAVVALAETAQAAAATSADASFTAAAFRDCSGLGRNLAIEVLEFFDQARFTRRIGDRHILLTTAEAVFGSPGA